MTNPDVIVKLWFPSAGLSFLILLFFFFFKYTLLSKSLDQLPVS